MNRIIFSTLFILSLCSESAFAFKKRDQRQCGEFNPEMARWFQARSNEEAPINAIIGAVKDQKVGWCFAYTAADMLSHASNIEISGAHVAKNYYAKSLMAMMRSALSFGRHEGGNTIDALKKNLDIPLCDEKSFPSSKYFNYEKVKTKECSSPVTEFNNYHVKSYKASGYYDGYTLFSELDKILRDGRIAGIEYDQSQLRNDKKNENEQTKADHASSIVSRYFDRTDSSCRYIIRNSVGKTCEKINSKKTKCFDGYYSVSEEQLNTMLIEVLSLENR